MPEPSFGDILGIAGSVGPASGNPAVVFDNRHLIDTLTTAARDKADNDIKKYHLFLDNLNQLSQDAQAIAGMDIMPQDRDLLDKQANEIFTLAAKTPKALSGRGPEGIKLQQMLAKWKGDATRSKQNQTFDYAHRQLLEKDPAFNTDANKKIVEDFSKAPLGERKEYLLNTPTQIDLTAISKGILDSPFVKQKFVERQDGLVKEGTRTKYEPYVAGLDAAYTTTPEIRTWSQERYAELPKSLQQKYQDKDGKPDYKSLFMDLGKGLFVSEIDPATGQKKDIESTDRVVQDQMAIVQQRAADRLKELGKEFDYNKRLESIRQAGRISVVKMREELRQQPLKERRKWLQKTTDALITDAQANGKDFNEGGFNGSVLPVSTATLKLFSVPAAGTGKPESPKQLIINTDGTVSSVFYNVDKDGKIKMTEQDKLKSKTFSQEEFKARFGKDILGQKESGSQLSDDEIDVGTETDVDTPPPATKDEPADPEPEVPASVDVSTLKDGSYKIKDGKNKGKTVIIKGGKVSSIK